MQIKSIYCLFIFLVLSFEQFIYATNDTSVCVHPNERTMVYPRSCHTLYLNPSPLLVPESEKGKDSCLEFELSQDRSFPSDKTIRSSKQPWNMFNIHSRMSSGRWYWRYRTYNAGSPSEWSTTYDFNISGNEPVFVTPRFSVLERNLPVEYPRQHCFLDEYLPDARKSLTLHPEYGELMRRAKSAINYEIKSPHAYDEINRLYSDVEYFLYPAYILTLDNKYREKMMDILHSLLQNEMTDKVLFQNDFFFPSVGVVLADIYDVCHELMSDSDRRKVEDILIRISSGALDIYRGKLENHIFDNHVWQKTLCGCMRAALMVYDKSPKALKFIEYCYEVWTSRAPASGFNRDGAWINGTGYFNTNVHTLYYMPMIFSYLTGCNFFDHPWYRSSGKSLVYSWLPQSGSTGFGDGSGISSEEPPFRLRLAFADVLARELHDPYAAWYVNSCGKTVHGDVTMRLYRMAKSHVPYSASNLSESSFENFVWYEDIGEGVAFSDMLHPAKNLSLCFRSSPFGSGSHTLSDQNSFKLLYKGKYVYMNAGYYQNFSDRHNLLQYRHTRGHNSVLVDGIGQPFTTRAYGNILRGMNSDNLSYFLGDASHAYCGVSEYPMWKKNFANSGVSQTPEYGFGPTPLQTFNRHIFLLRPNIVVIYDDLSAKVPVNWQWLLHSPVKFVVDGNVLTTDHSSRGGFVSVASLYSLHTPSISQTDFWYPGGEPDKPSDVEKQWHLKAEFPSLKQNRVLTIIQLTDNGEVDKIQRDGNSFRFGDWNVSAELDGEKQASISIMNRSKNLSFVYTPEKSILKDTVDGKYIEQDCRDKNVQPTY